METMEKVFRLGRSFRLVGVISMKSDKRRKRRPICLSISLTAEK